MDDIRSGRGMQSSIVSANVPAYYATKDRNPFVRLVVDFVVQLIVQQIYN